MDKYQRRRLRLRAEGRCQHCGKPCAPYYDCAERRQYKRLQRGGNVVSQAPQTRVIGVRNPADHHILRSQRPRFVAGRAQSGSA